MKLLQVNMRNFDIKTGFSEPFLLSVQLALGFADAGKLSASAFAITCLGVNSIATRPNLIPCSQGDILFWNLNFITSSVRKLMHMCTSFGQLQTYGFIRLQQI